jgi:hypothetical protein
MVADFAAEGNGGGYRGGELEHGGLGNVARPNLQQVHNAAFRAISEGRKGFYERNVR